jgi:hypothetical protein
VDDAVAIDFSPDDGLQSGFCPGLDNFGVARSVSLKDAKDRRLAGCAPVSPAPGPSAAEIGFITLAFAEKRGLQPTTFSNSLPDGMKNRLVALWLRPVIAAVWRACRSREKQRTSCLDLASEIFGWSRYLFFIAWPCFRAHHSLASQSRSKGNMRRNILILQLKFFISRR